MKTAFLTTISIAAFLSAYSAEACQVKNGLKITFFGYPDNDPAGGDIAYNCGRGFTAGGIGTFSDPVTFAAATGVFSRCEVIYIPYLKKYARFEDYCGQCAIDKNLGLPHIDIWTGSPSVNGGETQLRCEEKLTRPSKRIVRGPGGRLEVDTRPLFNGGVCSTNAIHDDSAIPVSTFCSRVRVNSGELPVAGSPGSDGSQAEFLPVDFSQLGVAPVETSQGGISPVDFSQGENIQGTLFPDSSPQPNNFQGDLAFNSDFSQENTLLSQIDTSTQANVWPPPDFSNVDSAQPDFSQFGLPLDTSAQGDSFQSTPGKVAFAELPPADFSADTAFAQEFGLPSSFGKLRMLRRAIRRRAG